MYLRDANYASSKINGQHFCPYFLYFHHQLRNTDIQLTTPLTGTMPSLFLLQFPQLRRGGVWKLLRRLAGAEPHVERGVQAVWL